MATKKTAAKAATAAPVKTAESKAAKFVELAQKRATKAINSIRGIQKLSNRGNYAYTPEQVDKICEALRQEVVELHEAFNRKPGQTKEGFKL